MTAAVLVPTERTAAPPRTPRLVAVPDCEPPLDDQPGSRQASPAPPLRAIRPVPQPRPAAALAPAIRPTAPYGPTPRPGALPVRSRPPLLPEQDRGRRSFPSPPRIVTVYAGAASGWSDDPMSPAVPTPTAALPAAHAAGTALSRALLEVLSGCRPIAQLRRHCVPGIFAGLPDAPALTADGGCRLLATRVCEPADGVAELAAAFRCGGRVRALAMRLEGIGGRWRITALQVG